MIRNVKIVSTAKYLPKRAVSSSELDIKMGLKDGWSEKKSGVKIRHFVEDETSSQMGAVVINQALEKAGLVYEDLDCIISASGVGQQAIPCTASLIQEQLGKGMSGTPCFDINSTCLSFVTALDTISYLIECNRFNRVAIVSSEISSVGLNWEHPESATLFGDGAVAFILEKTKENESSKLLFSKLETYSKGAHFSEIRGGGTLVHPRQYNEDTKEDFLFEMDGRAIFKLTSQLIEDYIDRLFEGSGLSMKNIDMVIPHQASQMAMRIIRKKIGIPEDKFMNIIENHGNVIAASIPMAFHEAISQGKIKRGDKVLFLGTSAGLSIGGVCFEY